MSFRIGCKAGIITVIVGIYFLGFSRQAALRTGRCVDPNLDGVVAWTCAGASG